MTMYSRKGWKPGWVWNAETQSPVRKCFIRRPVMRQRYQERNRGVVEVYETGATLKQTAERFGITGERVRQIILHEERRARRTNQNRTTGEQPDDKR